MTTDIIGQPVYTVHLTAPVAGEPASAAQVKTGMIDPLANRSRYLFLDAMARQASNMTLFTAKSSTTNDLQGVVAGPTPATAAVAFGEGALILSSATGNPDTASWTTRTPGGGYANTLRAGVLGSLGLVLCGDNNGIQTTTDSVTYTSRTPGAGAPSAIAFSHAAQGGGAYVLVGTSSGGIEIQSATALATWTRRTHSIASTDTIKGLVYHQGRFILVTLNSAQTVYSVYGSVDGSAWSLTGSITPGYASGYSTAGRGFAASPTRLVVASDFRLYYSDDLGASWQYQTIADGTFSVAYGRGFFVVAIATSGSPVISDVGNEWISLGWGVPAIGQSFAAGRWWAAGSVVGAVDGALYQSVRSLDF